MIWVVDAPTNRAAGFLAGTYPAHLPKSRWEAESAISVGGSFRTIQLQPI